jgi:hypothetical protein
MKRGSAGVEKMTVDELQGWLGSHLEQLMEQLP